MSRAPDRFARDFRTHALPQLSRLMPASAVLVALGRAGFAEEYDGIVRCAWDVGGWFLPDPLWHDLEDWIADELVGAITDIEAEIGNQDYEDEAVDEPLDPELTWAAYVRQEPHRDVWAEYAALCQEREMADAA